ncbi:MAG: hypothetical protein K8F91_14125 [Candidatus Obscuribacterales bacterium]|nr:hypothetical protein [Candidatus Obscuribacterales bacterium]
MEKDIDHTNSQEVRAGDALENSGAALSKPEQARKAASDDGAGSVATDYLPQCDVSDFLLEASRFENIDTDKNELLSEDEITQAIRSGDYNSEERKTLRYIKNAHDLIEDASNDEWGIENDGITRNDAKAYKPFVPDLKFNPLSDPFDKSKFKVWSESIAEQNGIRNSDGQEMTNAFRHALTSAVYTFKTGGLTTFALGEVNEAQRQVRDFFTEDGDHWLKDSKSDTYNNVVGIVIANDLKRQKRPTGTSVQLEDVVRESIRALDAGRLVTNIDKGENQYGKKLISFD